MVLLLCSSLFWLCNAFVILAISNTLETGRQAAQCSWVASASEMASSQFQRDRLFLLWDQNSGSVDSRSFVVDCVPVHRAGTDQLCVLCVLTLHIAPPTDHSLSILPLTLLTSTSRFRFRLRPFPPHFSRVERQPISAVLILSSLSSLLLWGHRFHSERRNLSPTCMLFLDCSVERRTTPCCVTAECWTLFLWNFFSLFSTAITRTITHCLLLIRKEENKTVKSHFGLYSLNRMLETYRSIVYWVLRYCKQMKENLKSTNMEQH